MVDVFVSYSRKDETDTGRVRLVARSLEKLGYQVFLDQKIPPGADFRSYLEARLQEAKCVLVLWSIASIKSPWVIDEATYAREQGKLLPACLDNNAPPMGFRALQSVSLDGWNGEHDHAEWLKLLHEIESRCGTPRPRGALRVTSQSPWHLILLVDDSNSMVGKPAQDMADGLKAMLAQFEIISKRPKELF